MQQHLTSRLSTAPVPKAYSAHLQHGRGLNHSPPLCAGGRGLQKQRAARMAPKKSLTPSKRKKESGNGAAVSPEKEEPAEEKGTPTRSKEAAPEPARAAAEEKQQPEAEEAKHEEAKAEAGKPQAEAAAAGGGPSGSAAQPELLAGQPPKDVVEEGRITFIYKPKVAAEEVHGIEDVQRFEMILSPTSRVGKHRLIIVGKKRLPDPSKHERFYAFVDAVGDSEEELAAGLGAEAYETKTRGEHTQPGARILGAGVYEICRHKKGARSHTHLVHRLELPAPGHGGKAQAELQCLDEGSYVLSIKNPSQKGRYPGLPAAGPPPAYSEEQRKQFGSYAWIAAEDPSLLDVAGAELLLIGAKGGVHDVEAELPEAEHHLEDIAKADEEKAEAETGEADAEAAVAKKLKTLGHPAEGVTLSTKPAETGEFV